MFDFLHTFKGPDFLFVFFVWFFALRLVVAIVRASGHDTPLVTFVSLFLFESLGIARIIVGSAHGMHKWDFLLIMMLLGGIAFFIRAAHLNFTGDGGGSGGGGGWTSSCSSISSSDSSSSSSSGGGGCGSGGGCGGCGSS